MSGVGRQAKDEHVVSSCQVNESETLRVGAVSVENEEDRVVGGWLGMFYKVLEPLHKDLCLHPAGLVTRRHRTRGCSVHQLRLHSYTWEDQHWWHVSSCRVHADFSRHYSVPLSAEVRHPTWRFPFKPNTFAAFVWTVVTLVSSQLYMRVGG